MSGSASIFISYSTQDEPAARLVRNLFEERGHDVQLIKFQQTMTDDFIMEFLRKEVAANDWLVALESEHARESNWVMFERAVAGIYRKRMYQIDLSSEGLATHNQHQSEYLREQVASISRRLSVYITYAHKDKGSEERICTALESEGYEILNTSDGVEFLNDVMSKIKHVMERGVMLVLVSDAGMSSDWVRHEFGWGIKLAKTGQGLMVPCIISNPTEGGASLMPESLQRFQYIDFSTDFERGLLDLKSRLAEL